ncbi:hypothetical protein H8E88_17240 [candidate division KSB1 bacterium]|nr:hypothetical protein [candidate division KSB1 bacterium]
MKNLWILPNDGALIDFHDPVEEYNKRRDRLVQVLENYGFRYFQGGRVLPKEIGLRRMVRYN